VCPMIKDEVGFLSEWLAYYELQGFDHVIFFDNNSTSSLAEIQPWVKTGFVEVVPDGWAAEDWLFKNEKNKFWDMMYIKYKSEVICKQRAIAMGIDVFVSVDIDEYIVPLHHDLTVMDELADWFTSTKRGVGILGKFQYNALPHFQEPINLLTIEAYTTRMNGVGKMTYYSSVGKL
jgi:hypothetical protein